MRLISEIATKFIIFKFIFIYKKLQPAVSLGALNFPDDVHALQNLAENDVSAVQPTSLLGGDEELGAVGVWSGVGHRQPPGAVVLQFEVLIGEAFTIDGTTW